MESIREEKGWKAFGALCGQLVLVPFLPFARTVELGESIVGGAYLYGAEFWGPFLMMETDGEGSRVNAHYLKWIHGFSRKKTRLERCFGWVPVRSLDDKAIAASVRVLEDALVHKGLLLRAVRQLVLNREHSGAVRQKARTWCGLLHARIQ